MYTSLIEIEQDYREKINTLLEDGKSLTATTIIELSVNLFHELKIKHISENDDASADMLLYQYGTYDWGDEFGECFDFGITRQFSEPTDDEPYQLNLRLIFESEPFASLKSYDCWSIDFSDINGFVENVKNSDGFKLANKFLPKAYELELSQC